MKLVAMAFAILPLAVTSIRNVAVFLLVAVPAVTALARPRDRAEKVRRASGERVGVNAAILWRRRRRAAVVTLAGWPRRHHSVGNRSDRAIRAIAVAALRFTTRGDGVLTWFVPEQKVFIDTGRIPTRSTCCARTTSSSWTATTLRRSTSTGFSAPSCRRPRQRRRYWTKTLRGRSSTQTIDGV